MIEEILSGIQDITFRRLGGRDVVRHKIVQDIVEAYDRYGSSASGWTTDGRRPSPGSVPAGPDLRPPDRDLD